ncbi:MULTISPECIES: DUF1524 domain-containing protein [unclassified Microbacterium]|uniref:GmrSD restriction endonuclease domain-containing protein n=1 Tax=unclassified Microbacterium TaxID=2609290 RepID=UPI00214AE5EA|nr:MULTISPECIES: DUF1524 domain-containing protein [unclassified Microbacterium]MCR2784558.1 DUF1524 domain-containing protein [Microbacterium sp. zg.B96]WIM14632.1 DUF1524 domain-containing protein [Microbacterium sp. zg-B96]
MAERKRRLPAWAWSLIGAVVLGVGLLVSPLFASGDEVVATWPSEAPTGTIAEPTATTGQTAVAVLSTLEVKGRAPQTGYEREEFGQRWLDVDRNGCDTRNDILARDLAEAVTEGGCKVITGTLADPFTGETISFLRGQNTSDDVQIDHVVALSDAWQKGAQQLTPEERARFANDPLNLLAVDGPANAQKGDSDAATWLPSNKGYRCAYVARQVSVKATYGLWVTPAEHDAIARVLESCPDEPALAPAYAPDAVESGPAPAPAETHYANCDAVRAAGAAPIRRGEPGFAEHLDRDNDGVGCAA